VAIQRLIAVRDFAFTTLARQTRHLTAGEVFEVAPVEAAALVYQKKAKFAPPSTPARQAAVPEDPPRRRYRRRDLRAED
jgi:hypothetical protein